MAQGVSDGSAGMQWPCSRSTTHLVRGEAGAHSDQDGRRPQVYYRKCNRCSPVDAALLYDKMDNRRTLSHKRQRARSLLVQVLRLNHHLSIYNSSRMIQRQPYNPTYPSPQPVHLHPCTSCPTPFPTPTPRRQPRAAATQHPYAVK